MNVGLAQELHVPIHDPLRLAETSRITIIGLYPRPGHVEAEVADDACEQAGAATARTGDEQQVVTHSMFPSRCAPVAQSKQPPDRRVLQLRRDFRAVAGGRFLSPRNPRG